MSQHYFPSLITVQPLNLLLALALVASWFVAAVQADGGLGTDAPGPSPNTGGESPAYNSAGASGSNGGLSTVAQIVIGVVVGVVGIGAIAGGVIYFLWRKKKWDETIKRYETIHAYHSARREAGRKQATSLRQQRRQRQREYDSERGMLEISEISDKTKEATLPTYDPSSFHKHQYSIDSSRGMSIDVPRDPFVSHHQHRHSSSFQSTISPIPPPPPLPVGSGKRTAAVTDRSQKQNNDSSVSAEQNSSSNQAKPDGPKKPKPILSRLITNL